MNLFLMKCEINVLHKAARWKHKGEKTQKASFTLLMELQGKHTRSGEEPLWKSSLGFKAFGSDSEGTGASPVLHEN